MAITKIQLDGQTLIDLSDNTKNTVTSSDQLREGVKTYAQDGSVITGTYTGIIPTGDIEITENGTEIDVSEYATATVAVSGGSSPTLETITVTPTKQAQVITPSSGYDGIEEVNVEAVTSSIDSNIKSANIITGKTILGVSGSAVVPSGTIRKTMNGDYDITNYKNIEVRVPEIMSSTLIRLLTFKDYTAQFELKNFTNNTNYEICLTTSNNPVAIYPQYKDNTAIGYYGNVGGWRNHTYNEGTPVESVNICIKCNSSGTISSVILTLFTSSLTGYEYIFTGSQLTDSSSKTAALLPNNINQIAVRSSIGIAINGAILNVPTTYAQFNAGLANTNGATAYNPKYFQFLDTNSNNLYLHNGSALSPTLPMWSLKTENTGDNLIINGTNFGRFLSGTLTGWQDCYGTIVGMDSKTIQDGAGNNVNGNYWKGTLVNNPVSGSDQYVTKHLGEIHNNIQSLGYIYFQLGVARSPSNNPFCLYDLKIYD